jgi:hypothetical protein
LRHDHAGAGHQQAQKGTEYRRIHMVLLSLKPSFSAGVLVPRSFIRHHASESLI